MNTICTDCLKVNVVKDADVTRHYGPNFANGEGLCMAHYWQRMDVPDAVEPSIYRFVLPQK